MKIKKQTITERVDYVHPFDLHGSANDIFNLLLEHENSYIKNYSNYDVGVITFNWNWECADYDDKGNDGKLALMVTRLETDKEHKERIAKLIKSIEKEKSEQQKQDEKELKEYLRLKEKFGDNYLHKKFEK